MFRYICNLIQQQTQRKLLYTQSDFDRCIDENNENNVNNGSMPPQSPIPFTSKPTPFITRDKIGRTPMINISNNFEKQQFEWNPNAKNKINNKNYAVAQSPWQQCNASKPSQSYFIPNTPINFNDNIQEPGSTKKITKRRTREPTTTKT